MFIAIALLLLNQATADRQTQGLQALDRHDYQTAEAVFSQIAATDPKDYSALFNLALAEVGLKKDTEAATHFQQTLSLRPGLYQAELNLGILYLRDNKAPDAVPLLQDVVRQKPDLAKPHLFLAQALQAQSKWPASQVEFEAALQHDPKDARAELGLAEALLHQGKLDESRPHFERAAAMDASLKSFLLELAVALVDKNRTADAILILEQFPDDVGAREKLGQIYLKAKQPEKAVPQFEAAVQLSPTTANKVALATAYMRSNQQPRALPLLEEALAKSPNDWDLQMTVGRIYRDQRQFGEAAKYFATATKLKPDDAAGWSELAGVLTLLKQYPQALTALDRIRELNAEKPGHIFLRAIILDNLRQLKPALATYKQFLEADNGQHSDQDFQSQGRIKAIEHELNRR
ncbi:MAG TPA: tetratricopeptide repeat protein [Bryobacteraceae bacterium]|nr:tetratricopeptide repeat protein [Bryobacteraceae bacterium]